MSDPITRTQQENAAVDATSISLFTNGPATTYVTRLGRVGKTLALLEQLVANAIAAIIGIGQYAPTRNDMLAAATNRAMIQNALDAGGIVRLSGVGVAYIDDSLIANSHTRLVPSEGLILTRLAGTGWPMVKCRSDLEDFKAVESAAWDGSLLLSLTATNHGVLEGGHVWHRGVEGDTPEEYFGVFPVVSVPDPDTFVLQLLRAPSGDPAGDMEFQLCVDEFHIDGGEWDYNSMGDTQAGTGPDLHCIIISGAAYSSAIPNSVRNTKKYAICTAGTLEVTTGVRSPGTASDGTKVYGPSTNDTSTKLSGSFGDDVHSMQPREATLFAAYDFAKGGSIIGYHIKNANALTTAANPGGSMHIYGHSVFKVLGTEMDICLSPSFGGGCPIILDCTQGTGTIGTVKIGTVIVGDTTDEDTGFITVHGSVTVERLRVDTAILPENPGEGAQSLFYVDGSGHLKSLHVGSITGNVANGGNVIRVRGTCDSIQVDSATCAPVAGATTANFINILPLGGIAYIGIGPSNLGAFANLVLVQATAAGNLRVALDRVMSSALCGVNTALACRVTLRNCDLGSATNGAVLANNVTVDIFDEGNNSYVSGKLGLVTGSGVIKAHTFAALSGSIFKDFSFTSGVLQSDGRLGLGNIHPEALVGAPLLGMEKAANGLSVLATYRNNDSGSSARAVVAYNAFGNTWFLGMGSSANNSNAFVFGTDVAGTPTDRLTISTGGNVTLTTGQLIVSTQKTPASASATGVKGTICQDTNYIYVCTATDTWKRTAIATW